MSGRNLKQHIADRVRLARKEAGFTQTQLATVLGLHRVAITNIESGQRDISATELVMLAETLGVSVGWLACEAETAKQTELSAWKAGYLEASLVALRAAEKLHARARQPSATKAVTP